ncbi:hypothetical protein AB6D75_24175 [Vibrio splendidus]
MSYSRNTKTLLGAIFCLSAIMGCSDAPSDVELQISETEIESIKDDGGVFYTFYPTADDIKAATLLNKDKRAIDIFYDQTFEFADYKTKDTLVYNSRIENYSIEDEALKAHVESKFSAESLEAVQGLFDEYVVSMLQRDQEKYKSKLSVLKEQKKAAYPELVSTQERLLTKPQAQLEAAEKQVSELQTKLFEAYKALSQQVNKVIIEKELPFSTYDDKYNWNRVFNVAVKRGQNASCRFKDDVQVDNAKYCWVYSYWDKHENDFNLATRPETKSFLIAAITADAELEYARVTDDAGTPYVLIAESKRQIKDANIIVKNKFGDTLNSRSYKNLQSNIRSAQNDLNSLLNPDSRTVKKLKEQFANKFTYHDKAVKRQMHVILGADKAYAMIDEAANKHRESVKHMEFEPGETFPYNYGEKSMFTVLYVKDKYTAFGNKCIRDEEYFDRIEYEHDNFKFKGAWERPVDSWLDYVSQLRTNRC